MNSYKTWKKKHEATVEPVTDDPAQADDVEPTDDDKLFYKGAYAGQVGQVIARLAGLVLTDSRFKRPAIKGLLLQDIILALGLNNDVALLNRLATRIRNQINTAQNPGALQFGSPTLAKALERKGINRPAPEQPQQPQPQQPRQ